MNRQRRRFLRAAAAGGTLYAFGRTAGTVYAQASGGGSFPDYKAMVCLFMFGGNDSWNMVVPRSDAAYNAYSTSRGGATGTGLALPQAQLLPLNLQTADPNGTTFGLHPAMTGLQSLFNTGKAAVVANVGPLIEPTTKAQYQGAKTSGHRLPPQLFSHNDQQDQWHSLRGREVLRSGWGGRVAAVLATQTAAQQLSLNVSLAGQTFFQAGELASPYVMGATGATAFQGFAAGGTGLARRRAFEAIADAEYPTAYQRGFAQVQRRAVQFADRVNDALTASVSFNALADTDATLSPLATQLRTVAKMISVRDRLTMSRQIFFVSTGGFDTHDDLLADQPGLLGNVSSSVKAFYDALTEIGMENNVTLFSHSDFGRTLTSNGDGSDHAWGGVQFLLGGAVRGGRIYGSYPSLALGGPQDVGGGRLIPTTSADQYAATLASWFGVEEARLGEVAPSIGNFALRNLGFFA